MPVVKEVFSLIRDGIHQEFRRAIQDSESYCALKQKKMIYALANKGFSKNEIVREMQLVFGNDILIYPQQLDFREGSRLGVFKKVFFMGLLASPFALRVLRRAR